MSIFSDGSEAFSSDESKAAFSRMNGTVSIWEIPLRKSYRVALIATALVLAVAGWKLVRKSHHRPAPG